MNEELNIMEEDRLFDRLEKDTDDEVDMEDTMDISSLLGERDE